MSSEQQTPLALVSGGTGFVGGALIERLVEEGFAVRCLTRDASTAEVPDGVLPVQWGDLDSALAGVDVVVHLAGEKAVGERLTEAKKRSIMDSRVKTTAALVDAMGRMDRRPATFVCASAIGYYGNRPWGEEKTEDSEPGDDFLAQVCINWERESVKAEALGIRTVRTRIGIVLGKEGPLPVMALPFKMFVGGPIAGGKQPFSWIDIRDAVEALLFCARNEELSGPVNIVSPEATTNEEMSKKLARTLRRPNLFPVPKFGLKLLFSEGAETIAGGQHVKPVQLQQAGFDFSHVDLDEVLRDHL